MTHDERLNLRAQQILDDEVLLAQLRANIRNQHTVADVLADISDTTIREAMRIALEAS